MRIIIEIDGTGVSAVATQAPGVSSISPDLAAAPMASAIRTAPPEVLAAAAALGAEDAGPAPTEAAMMALPTAGLPLPVERPVTPEAGDIDAGGAPGVAPGAA